MITIYAYQKLITEIHTIELIFPESDSHRIGNELATIDGVTYVSIPSEFELPEQRPEITVKQVELTPELRQKICDVSPLVKVIRNLVAEKIADKYTTNDEIKLIRTQPSTEFDIYNTYVEECRTWGREQKSKIGL